MLRVEAPPEVGAPYRVVAIVRNHGSGHGEVQVTLWLRDPATGEMFQQQERVTLASEETAHVAAEILAPPGHAYAPEAEAEYPPR